MAQTIGCVEWKQRPCGLEGRHFQRSAEGTAFWWQQDDGWTCCLWGSMWGPKQYFPFMQNNLLSLVFILHKHPFVFSKSLARFFPPLTILLRVLSFSQSKSLVLIQMLLGLTSTGYSSKGPGFNSQHPHSLQLSVTPVPWDLIPSSGLHWYCLHRV